MNIKLKECFYCNEISFNGNSCLTCGLDIDSRVVPSDETLENIKYKKENNIKTQLIEWCTNIEKAPKNKRLLIIYKQSLTKKLLIEFAILKNNNFYSYLNNEIIDFYNVVSWSDYEIPSNLIFKD